MRSHGPFQAVQISTEKEAKQGPETTAPQDPEEFKATPGPQLFTRCQCLSETEEQQNPQPVWDKEPKFWSDTLTQELWKLFRENPENQQAQEGEGPSLAGWGGCLGCPGKPHCSPSLPPHLLSWRPTEELLGLVSTLGWDPQHTSALQCPSHFIPALCWVQPWTPRHLLGSPESCVP